MLPRLHIVTDDAVLAAADFPVRAEHALAAGGPLVALHVRGRHTTGARLYALTHGLRVAASRHGARLIVNDRVDVAIAAGADGVQLGAASLSARSVRALLGAGRTIGYSAHAAEEAASAVRNGADYVLLGTIWETASHPGAPAAGTRLVRAAAGVIDAPLLAIGGVTPQRVGELHAAGAYGAAVLGGVWRAADPAHAVNEYLSAIADAYGAAVLEE